MTTATQPVVTDADRQAVAAVPQRIVAAWAAHDAGAFAAVFTEDGSMILPGVLCRGRVEIRDFMADRFTDRYQGTRVTGSPLDLRFLTADSAVLVTQGGVLRPGETEVSDAEAIRAMWIVTRRDGGWLLAAYQNTPRDER
jgi:uncharacterized protein (TIGR02246 family)